MVKETAPALSPKCINSLIELVKSKDAGAAHKEWSELLLALKTALPSTEKEENRDNG